MYIRLNAFDIYIFESCLDLRFSKITSTGPEEVIAHWSGKIQGTVVPPRKIDALRLNLVEFFLAISYTKHTPLCHILKQSCQKLPC